MIEQIFRPTASTVLGVWQINETIDVLSNNISEEDLNTIEGYHPHKKVEFLATRQLMAKLCENQNMDYRGIRKDEHGKPFLIESNVHVSVAHAYPFVSCLMNYDSPCGIDIEKPRVQLLRIKHKFLNESELDRCKEDLGLLCLHWCAKEVLYKIYGRKELIFIDNLFVRSIEDELLECEVSVRNQISKHILKYFNHLGYFVVYNV